MKILETRKQNWSVFLVHK